MIIQFKLEDYEEICDKYAAIFEHEDTVDVTDTEGNLLMTRMRRIVIPQLHASFREAEWYVLDENAEDIEDDDAWEIQSSVFVQYTENEKDPDKYISFASCDLSYLACELCGEDCNDYDTISQLDCYIDTDEFVDDEIINDFLASKNERKEDI